MISTCCHTRPQPDVGSPATSIRPASVSRSFMLLRISFAPCLPPQGMSSRAAASAALPAASSAARTAFACLAASLVWLGQLHQQADKDVLYLLTCLAACPNLPQACQTCMASRGSCSFSSCRLFHGMHSSALSAHLCSLPPIMQPDRPMEPHPDHDCCSLFRLANRSDIRQRNAAGALPCMRQGHHHGRKK